ncbi:MAG TPA: hypothetical protein VHF22_09395, partial [Planctomycetota bacterium]|nr:hypothetical protein [Planctomycetota bacterium]
DPRPELVSAEDYALWLRVARSGRHAHVPEALVRYRIHDSGISRFPDRSYGAERAAVEPFLEEALRAGLVSRRFVRDRLTAIDFEHGYALLRCGRRAAARRFLRAWIGSPSRWRALGLAALALIRPRAPGGA